MRYDDLPAVGSVALPALPFKSTPNKSPRGGRWPRLVFAHVWGGGTFDGTTSWLRDPESEASSHVVYAGEVGRDAGRCVQLVPWSLKAWTECDLNPVGISVEFADAIFTGRDPRGFAVAARIIAGLCHFHLDASRYVTAEGIVAGAHGFTFHRTAGALGCGHTHCPTDDAELLSQFRARVVAESRHKGWRRDWGRT